MNLNLKIITFVSLIISVAYYLFSLAYFFGGFCDPMTESRFRESLETVVTLPAVIIFAYRFTQGINQAVLAGILIFLVLFACTFIVTLIISRIIQNKKAQKPNKPQ